jgi:hypothetical protein
METKNPLSSLVVCECKLRHFQANIYLQSLN